MDLNARLSEGNEIETITYNENFMRQYGNTIHNKAKSQDLRSSGLLEIEGGSN